MCADRMTMAHGLEARVPFLDVAFSRTAMSVDPARKMVDKAAVAANGPGREKTFLRELFRDPVSGVMSDEWGNTKQNI